MFPHFQVDWPGYCLSILIVERDTRSLILTQNLHPDSLVVQVFGWRQRDISGNWHWKILKLWLKNIIFIFFAFHMQLLYVTSF